MTVFDNDLNQNQLSVGIFQSVTIWSALHAWVPLSCAVERWYVKVVVFFYSHEGGGEACGRSQCNTWICVPNPQVKSCFLFWCPVGHVHPTCSNPPPFIKRKEKAEKKKVNVTVCCSYIEKSISWCRQLHHNLSCFAFVLSLCLHSANQLIDQRSRRPRTDFLFGIILFFETCERSTAHEL